MLQATGHGDARVAYTGATALALALEFVPTDLLLDLHLPDISGYDVARHLSQHNAGPKPGTRLVQIVGQAPPGSGTHPRFALFAPSTAATAGLLEQFSPVLDQDLRPPIRPQALWLIRPDGYIACAAAIGDEGVIARYLTDQLSEIQCVAPSRETPKTIVVHV